MSGRLALLRWVLRVVRAERRQHTFVIVMIACGIAIATLLISSALRFREPSEREFAGAQAYGWVSGFGEDPTIYADIQSGVEDLLTNHPDLEAQVGSRRDISGAQLLGADPEAPLGAVNFSLLSGRWPAQGEVSITTRAREFLEEASGELIEIGQVVPIGGVDRTVVGIWENPNDLSRGIALVLPADAGPWEEVTMLFPTEGHAANEQLLAIANERANGSIGAYIQDRSLAWVDPSGAYLAYLAGTILSFQVAVLASAGFTVLAQRRTRQLGMLSAMGATPRRLGSVMQFTGLVCGVIGGMIGFGGGILLSVAATPLLQSAVNHRLSAFDLPWGYLLPMLPLAVVTAMVAAWWPARRIRQTSTIDAIASRRPPETNVTPSFAIGLVLLGLGGWLLGKGAPLNSPAMVVGGAAALAIGALLLIPGLVSVLGATAGRTPLPMRIAWRDINRNRSRSAAAIAAVTMAIALPFGLASFAASLAGSWVPQTPPNIVSVYADHNGAPVTLADGEARFAPLLDVVPGARLYSLETPVDVAASEEFLQPGQDPDSPEAQLSYSINMIRGSGLQGTNTAFATPELLDLMSIDPPPAGTDLMVFFESKLDLPDASLVVERHDPVPGIFPEVLIFGDLPGISRDRVVVTNWLLAQDAPFTTVQLDALSAFTAQDTSFAIGSTPDSPPPFLTIRAIALAVAGLLGISVVAVSVALIRVENETDARALNAVGASPSTSRWIGAATAAGIVAVAVAVAVPASFLALSSVYLNPDEDFNFTMPWLELGVVAAALPLVAAAGGWLLTTTRVTRVSV